MSSLSLEEKSTRKPKLGGSQSLRSFVVPFLPLPWHSLGTQALTPLNFAALQWMQTVFLVLWDPLVLNGGQGSERKSSQATPFSPLLLTRDQTLGHRLRLWQVLSVLARAPPAFSLILPAGSLPRNWGSHAQLLAWPDPSTWSRETQAGSSLSQMLRSESQRWTPGFSH